MPRAKRAAKRPAAKKSAKQRGKKAAAKKKPAPKKAPGKPAPAKKAPGKRGAPKKLSSNRTRKSARAHTGGEDIVYSDVRRELRDGLIGRLLGG